MRTRTTNADLMSAVARLNRALSLPTDPYTRDPNGRTVAVVGVYCLYRAYGATRLVQIANPAGGERDITPFLTKRELLGRIHSMLDGIEAAMTVLRGDDARLAAMQDERDGDALMQDAEIAASLV